MTDRFYLGLEWNPVTGRRGDVRYFDLDEIAAYDAARPNGLRQGCHG